MLVNAQDHANLRVMPIYNGLAAAQQPTVDLVTSDVGRLASHLPIILPASPGALPQALVTTTRDDDVFSGHVPRSWQDYPFSLVEKAIGIGADGESTTQTVLWAAPNAPHWSPFDGFRLFGEDGQPTGYLRGVLSRLKGLQEEIDHTRQLTQRLHDTGALTQMYVHHQDQWIRCFDIDLTALTEALEEKDESLTGQALCLAMRIKDSQAGLKRQTTKPDNQISQRLGFTEAWLEPLTDGSQSAGW